MKKNIIDKIRQTTKQKVFIIISILIVFLVVCLILIISYLFSWKNKIKLSELKIKDGYIIGDVENTTGKYYEANIKFQLKNGSIKSVESCNEDFKPHKTKKIECMLVNDETNDYKIKVKNIELKEKKIPRLKNGKISINVLKYYFENIYDSHTLNFVSFSTEDIKESYPYINEIKYTNNNTIEIETNITFEETIASFNETYDVNNSELKSMTFTITSAPDSSEDIISDSVAEKILTKVSTMKSLATYDFYSSIDILRALKRKDIDFGYCVKVDDWCIYPDYVTQNFYLFSIHRNQ